ncbi:DUF6461 domain-containing protein [Streptosporangium roseum]|uniref:Uncharacterized protein n=1 Tax=Streptosporangium roseum (strain ATCC 12428 / DSM 43021 / JCM 3005 / KCTC 9067 / NCIMB 10171 / NRRL 2505 / NI 9100) TaxID=479432 RepID=D2AVV5_STRRD|nr:DUF6461 domain-containing protein [Streptosporangium roseum]ACZ83074.1 hypothetical protein Sros_0014 [Streptosporangium roseum DSM 43021]
MTSSPAEFHWLSDEGPLDDIFCISFIRGLPPLEVLARLGVDEITIKEMTFDEFNELAVEQWISTGGDAPDYVGAVKLGNWAILVEPLGWRVPTYPNVLNRLSEGTEVVSVSRHEYASDEFVHVINRDVIVRFDPLSPQYRTGVDPKRWEAVMARVGLGPFTSDDSMPDDPIASAFALASEITGVSFTADVLDQPFLVAVATTE